MIGQVREGAVPESRRTAGGRQIAVIQVIAGLDPADGGPPASAVATALALRKEGLDNLMAFPVERGREDAVAGFVALLRANGISVNSFPEPWVFGSFGRRWGASPRLALWLLRNGSRFDVIHVHAAWTFTAASGLLAAKMHRRLAVLSTHESLTEFDREKSGPVRARIKEILRWLYVSQFDAVVAASTLEQSDMGDRGRLRSSVVPHAVIGEPGVIPNPSIGNELRVGFLGRLHPKKNLELLLEAWALLPEQVSLYVAGDGTQAYRRALVHHAVSCDVDKRIRWLGFVEGTAKREFLASIDLLVMPSAFECFGVAAAEALIAGLPVVVSSEVGLAKVVEQYDCGRVIAPSAEAIASAVNELMDGGLRQELSTNARLAAAQEFSIAAHGRRIKHEYEEAFARRREAVAL